MTKDDLRSPTETSRVFFSIGSKEGFAEFSILHAPANQSLVLPVYPSNAIPDSLAFLDPVFAHYAEQWEKFMVRDPSERDSASWYLEARYFPPNIAPLSHAQKLNEIALRHIAPEILNFIGGPEKLVALSVDVDMSNVLYDLSNYVPAQDLDIEIIDPKGK